MSDLCACVCIDFGVDYNRINSLQSDICEYTLFSHAYFMLLSKLTLYVCPVVGSVQETCNFDVLYSYLSAPPAASKRQMRDANI